MSNEKICMIYSNFTNCNTVCAWQCQWRVSSKDYYGIGAGLVLN